MGPPLYPSWDWRKGSPISKSNTSHSEAPKEENVKRCVKLQIKILGPRATHEGVGDVGRGRRKQHSSGGGCGSFFEVASFEC